MLDAALAQDWDERARHYALAGKGPPVGERGDTLLAIAHLRAGEGWTNHQIFADLQLLGRDWGKFREGNLYEEAVAILGIIRNVRRKGL